MLRVSTTQQGFPVLKPNPDMRAAVLALEAVLLQMPEYLEEVEIHTRHLYAEGVYLREMTAKAGTLLTGRTQHEVNANILSKGKVLVASEFGVYTYTAPCTFISPKGDKRVIWVMEDCIWTGVIHNPSNSQDFAAWEDQYLIS